MDMKRINLPITKSNRKKLKVGEAVLLSGTVYTARDAAHKNLQALIDGNKSLPVPIKDEIIYYAGPTPAPPGRAIGSCGPTTSSRMDVFTPALLKKGLGGMIGKGERSKSVKQAIKKYGAVYFIATGGAGALLSKRIKKAKCVSLKHLGPEAIYSLEVEDFPVIVAVDSKGRSIYQMRP